jgi:hypothetical protein
VARRLHRKLFFLLSHPNWSVASDACFSFSQNDCGEWVASGTSVQAMGLFLDRVVLGVRALPDEEVKQAFAFLEEQKSWEEFADTKKNQDNLEEAYSKAVRQLKRCTT